MIRFYGQFGWGEKACDFQEKDDNFGEKQPQDEMDFGDYKKDFIGPKMMKET